MNARLSTQSLKHQNREFKETGGISSNNRQLQFVPAFKDTETGEVCTICNPDGSPSLIHNLNAAPRSWIVQQDASGRVLALKGTIVAGFVLDQIFYTRQQAADYVAQQHNKSL